MIRLKQKKVPMRSCVVTKEKYPKKELIRVVRDNLGNVKVDPTGKLNGHGAYLKKDLEVIEMAEKTKILDKYLQTEVKTDVYKELKSIVDSE